MRTIYKYRLTPDDKQNIQMPSDARIRCVNTQPAQAGKEDNIHLWAEVDTASKETSRTIRIFGTGHAMPDDRALRYIGTIQLYTGKLVFHVYEELEA
jgi:hypothetical protein